jgi:hypothetical protein
MGARECHPAARHPACQSREFQDVAFQLDEQLRRYQDLARRAGDLRSYL